ncbi:MAG: helix-turn-helix domain-containing protein [Candidatus Eisenbacteria sp.]|nr:helix-turn-helix domain-containing protein [Candidatus Eisenbacteria bacterium]
MTSETRALLRPADVAPQLGVTTGRIYQLIASGVIPATRVGGAIRIPREAWEQWLATHRDRALRSSSDLSGAAVPRKRMSTRHTGQVRPRSKRAPR